MSTGSRYADGVAPKDGQESPYLHRCRVIELMPYRWTAPSILGKKRPRPSIRLRRDLIMEKKKSEEKAKRYRLVWIKDIPAIVRFANFPYLG